MVGLGEGTAVGYSEVMVGAGEAVGPGEGLAPAAVMVGAGVNEVGGGVSGAAVGYVLQVTGQEIVWPKSS